MNESEFWEIVEQARSASGDMFERPVHLKHILNSRTPDQIQGFAENYRDQILRAYTWPLWGAAYVISGGCSDDGFDYFRDWLISEGEKIYTKALEDPESLSELDELEEPELEEYRYVADEVYEQKTGKTLTLRKRDYPADPGGKAWNEESVYEMFPNLAKKYG